MFVVRTDSLSFPPTTLLNHPHTTIEVVPCQFRQFFSYDRSSYVTTRTIVLSNTLPFAFSFCFARYFAVSDNVLCSDREYESQVLRARIQRSAAKFLRRSKKSGQYDNIMGVSFTQAAQVFGGLRSADAIKSAKGDLTRRTYVIPRHEFTCLLRQEDCPGHISVHNNNVFIMFMMVAVHVHVLSPTPKKLPYLQLSTATCMVCVCVCVCVCHYEDCFP